MNTEGSDEQNSSDYGEDYDDENEEYDNEEGEEDGEYDGEDEYDYISPMDEDDGDPEDGPNDDYQDEEDNYQEVFGVKVSFRRIRRIFNANECEKLRLLQTRTTEILVRVFGENTCITTHMRSFVMITDEDEKRLILMGSNCYIMYENRKAAFRLDNILFLMPYVGRGQCPFRRYDLGTDYPAMNKDTKMEDILQMVRNRLYVEQTGAWDIIFRTRDLDEPVSGNVLIDDRMRDGIDIVERFLPIFGKSRIRLDFYMKAGNVFHEETHVSGNDVLTMRDERIWGAEKMAKIRMPIKSLFLRRRCPEDPVIANDEGDSDIIAKSNGHRLVVHDNGMDYGVLIDANGPEARVRGATTDFKDVKLFETYTAEIIDGTKETMDTPKFSRIVYNPNQE